MRQYDRSVLRLQGAGPDALKVMLSAASKGRGGGAALATALLEQLPAGSRAEVVSNSLGCGDSPNSASAAQVREPMWALAEELYPVIASQAAIRERNSKLQSPP